MNKKLLAFSLLLLGLAKGVCAYAQDSLSVADSLFAAGKFTEAINTYSGVNTRHADVQIAKAYDQLGNYGKSVLQYEYLVTKYPEDLQLKRDLGALLFRTRKFESAAATYESLLSIDSLNPELNYKQGQVFYAWNKDSIAIRYFQRAFELDTNHVKSAIALGEHYLKYRKYDTVHFYADRGLTIAPEHAKLLNIKALAWFNNYRFKEAVPYFEKLMANNYRDQYILMRLAHSYAETWEPQKALKLYKEVVKVDADQADAYNAMGKIYFKHKQLDSAMVCFKKVIAINNTDLSNEYVSIASIYRAKEDLNSALTYYKMAADEDPDNALIYYNVCEIIDKLYADKQVKLRYYEKFLNEYSDSVYMTVFRKKVEDRIAELKG
ncbi:tetratricopeptide repeat protein [Robertkochia solimangrovi]|uniref:tetratricopeptide repeat protein n=1 Tax=Robertkochia solimangrovi TaxID=2213046 RepID=UPI00117FD771|nr:tetratricopeptide repeat protein [Robertkochia solimangrovi]TRZ46354.1 hypothetical protein DMZ48_03620 [Robertkochia solimangrovi]